MMIKSRKKDHWSIALLHKPKLLVKLLHIFFIHTQPLSKSPPADQGYSVAVVPLIHWGSPLKENQIVKYAQSLPKARVVLIDHSAEGTQLEIMVEKYVKLLHAHRSKPKNNAKTFFVTGNFTLSLKRRDLCLYFNSLLQQTLHMSPKPITPCPNTKPTHRFLALGGTTRKSKTYVLTKLHAGNMLGSKSKFCWSYGKINLAEASAHPLDTSDSKLAAQQRKFNALLPRTIDIPCTNKAKTVPGAFNASLYARGRFHVVLETEMTHGSIRRFTEKTFKCFLAKRAFVVFGNPGTLDLLHKQGYRTFHPLVNESYDTEKDPVKRCRMILQELTRLDRLPFREFYQFTLDCKPMIEHNFQRATCPKHHAKNFNVHFRAVVEN